jgi:rhomboid family GlyGly-CTERM serine protease
VTVARRVAWVFPVLAAFSVVVFLVPGAGNAMQFDREAIAAGEWYRLLTGHWAHWTLDHLAWDSLVFAALGWAVARLSPARACIAVVLAVAAIPAAVWVLLPEMSRYRGLSGLDSALFAVLAGSLLRHGRLWRREGFSILAAAMLVAFAGKVAFEVAGGKTLFVAPSDMMDPVPLAHAVGGLIGLATGTLGAAGSGPAAAMGRPVRWKPHGS